MADGALRRVLRRGQPAVWRAVADSESGPRRAAPLAGDRRAGGGALFESKSRCRRRASGRHQPPRVAGVRIAHGVHLRHRFRAARSQLVRRRRAPARQRAIRRQSMGLSWGHSSAPRIPGSNRGGGRECGVCRAEPVVRHDSCAARQRHQRAPWLDTAQTRRSLCERRESRGARRWRRLVRGDAARLRVPAARHRLRVRGYDLESAAGLLGRHLSIVFQTTGYLPRSPAAWLRQEPDAIPTSEPAPSPLLLDATPGSADLSCAGSSAGYAPR